MTSDNIAEYVGENNQFTEKPVTEYPPVIQNNTVTTKDYLYSNNIDTDLLVVIGGLIVILFLMMLIMYFINSLRHKELTEILTKISFPEKSGSNSLKPEAVSCNLLSLCVLAPVFFTPRKLAEVSREIIVASAQEIAWTPGSSRIDGHQAENITWAISSQSPADKYDLINKTSRVSPDSGRFYEPDTVLDHRERVAELAAKKAQARQALSIYLNLPTLDEAVNTLKPWWPGLFDGDTPRLLACGIRDVLLEDVAQRNIPLSHKKLRRALKAITRSESYLCAMKAGACRYDTEGYVTEHISQEEEAYAAARLDKIRRQNRIKAELQAVLDEK